MTDAKRPPNPDDTEANTRADEKSRKRKAARDKMLATKTIEKGLLIVHTGKGKGKSTAAFGLAAASGLEIEQPAAVGGALLLIFATAEIGGQAVLSVAEPAALVKRDFEGLLPFGAGEAPADDADDKLALFYRSSTLTGLLVGASFIFSPLSPIALFDTPEAPATHLFRQELGIYICFLLAPVRRAAARPPRARPSRLATLDDDVAAAALAFCDAVSLARVRAAGNWRARDGLLVADEAARRLCAARGWTRADARRRPFSWLYGRAGVWRNPVALASVGAVAADSNRSVSSRERARPNSRGINSIGSRICTERRGGGTDRLRVRAHRGVTCELRDCAVADRGRIRTECARKRPGGRALVANGIRVGTQCRAASARRQGICAQCRAALPIRHRRRANGSG